VALLSGGLSWGERRGRGWPGAHTGSAGRLRTTAGIGVRCLLWAGARFQAQGESDAIHRGASSEETCPPRTHACGVESAGPRARVVVRVRLGRQVRRSIGASNAESAGRSDSMARVFVWRVGRPGPLVPGAGATGARCDRGAGTGGVPRQAHSETRGARHPNSGAWSHRSPCIVVTKCGHWRLGEGGRQVQRGIGASSV
jgi:hypothetical protein